MDHMTVMTGDVLDLNGYKTYGEYKAALDGELQKSAESFVRIGFLLKVARDTDILTESGYRSVNEFAEKEYGLDKSQVSRFIRINDEFSENGYSDRLQEHYRSFGYAKLAMMLLLPAEINEELSSSYSKAEIQAIREEVDEEMRTTDLEVMLEEQDGRQQDHSALGRVLYQIGKDNPELYLGIHDAVCSTAYDGTVRPVGEKLMDVLAPAGEATISVRVAREGRKMLIIRGADIDPVLVEVRSGGKQSYTWDQMTGEMETMCPDAEDPRKAWEIFYGKPFPEEQKAEVAPVQPKKEQGSRKVSKVTKAKKPEKTPAESRLEPSVSIAGQNGAKEQNGVQEKPVETEDRDGQEAAGSENGENKTQGEACADSGQACEPTADPEPADKEDGAAGGAGEDGARGSADGEGGAGTAPVPPDVGQIEGQMDITEFPEYMPDAEGDGQEKPAEAAGVEDPGGKIKDSDGMRRHIENQKQIIADAISLMGTYCDQGIWDRLIEEANAIITRAESIKNMEEMWHG